MSAVTDPRGQFLARQCSSGAIVLAGVLLVSLGVGLWPELIHPSEGEVTAPPALQSVGVGNVVFWLLVWPLVVLRRFQRTDRRPGLRAMLGEWVVCLIASLPFYAVGAFFGARSTADAGRTLLAVAMVWPVAALSAAWLTRRGVRTGVLLALVLIAFAPPAVYYIIREWYGLSPVGPADLALQLGPLTLVAEVARARGQGWLPRPVWAAAAWSAAFVAVGVIAKAAGGRKAGTGPQNAVTP